MQQFIDVVANDKLSVSRQLLMDNLYTVMSNNSGETFPIANLTEGMLFFRNATDEKAFYAYIPTINADEPWVKLLDLYNSYGDAKYLEGHPASYFATSDHLHDSRYLQLTGGKLTGELTAEKFIGDLEGSATYIEGKSLNEIQGLPIGHEFFTFNPNIQPGCIALIGTMISRDVYPALWEWVQQQNGYLISEELWQEKASTQGGNVPYYSTGDNNTTFRVPALKCWVRGAGKTSEIGGYLAAGLPNITGQVGAIGSSGAVYKGAFYKYGSGGVLSNSGEADYTAGFDASRSNSIYGKSSTVQPQSIIGVWCVKAYGTAVNTGNADITTVLQEYQKIAEQMNALPTKLMTQDKYSFAGSTQTSLLNCSNESGDYIDGYHLSQDPGLSAQTTTVIDILNKILKLTHTHRAWTERYNCECNCSDGDGCFIEAEIATPNGYKDIKNIQVGDYICCADGYSHKVKYILSKTLANRNVVKFDNGLILTGDHIIFTKQGAKTYNLEAYHNCNQNFTLDNGKVATYETPDVMQAGMVEDIECRSGGFARVFPQIIEMPQDTKTYTLVIEDCDNCIANGYKVRCANIVK